MSKMQQGPILLEGKKPSPRYASLGEMEIVSPHSYFVPDEQSLAQTKKKEINMVQAIEEIRKAIGPDADDIISTDPDDLHAHGYSEWSSTNPEGLPVAVAYPRSTEQVSTIARICYKYRVPIIPYSGGSSLEGNFSAPFGGISVDFAYMDKIVRFNRDDMDIVVQPSIGWQDLNAQLAKMDSGLFFPVDPGK